MSRKLFVLFYAGIMPSIIIFVLLVLPVLTRKDGADFPIFELCIGLWFSLCFCIAYTRIPYMDKYDWPYYLKRLPSNDYINRRFVKVAYYAGITFSIVINALLSKEFLLWRISSVPTLAWPLAIANGLIIGVPLFWQLRKISKIP